MKNNIRIGIDYLKHLITAKYRNGHGVHSPAVYEFVSEVLFDTVSKNEYKELENLIKNLKRDNTEIDFTELGGGSYIFNKSKRKISLLANSSSVCKKYGRLLYRIAKHYQPTNTLEIGTSIGISTLYIALGAKKTKIYTLEGNASAVDVAKQNAKKLHIDNIHFNIGLFDKTLPEVLKTMPTPEFVYIDGNHTYEATIQYFNQTFSIMKKGIIVLDDIYWSDGMKKAWKEIASESTVALDLFQFGIILKGEMLTPGYYKIRF